MFSTYFPGFLRVREVRTILGVFEVFLGIFEKTKEKKDRVAGGPDCNTCNISGRGGALIFSFFLISLLAWRARNECP